MYTPLLLGNFKYIDLMQKNTEQKALTKYVIILTLLLGNFKYIDLMQKNTEQKALTKYVITDTG